MNERKKFAIFLVILVLAAVAIFWVEHKSEKTDQTGEPIPVSSTNDTQVANDGTEATSAAVSETTASRAAATDSQLLGSWRNDDLGYSFIYTFNADGTGQYDIMGSAMEFTYDIDGNKVAIAFPGDTGAFETEYRIDGETLSLMDSFGNATLYQKMN